MKPSSLTSDTLQEDQINLLVPVRDRKRSTANIVGISVFSLLASIAVAFIIIGLLVIGADDAGPDSEAKGLSSIIISLFLYPLVPLSVVLLFVLFVLIANLKIPQNFDTLPSESLKIYRSKSIVASVIMFTLGLSSIILFIVLPQFDSKYSLWSLVIPAVEFSLVPLTVLSTGWAFLYLLRANAVSRKLLKNKVDK